MLNPGQAGDPNPSNANSKPSNGGTLLMLRARLFTCAIQGPPFANASPEKNGNMSSSLQWNQFPLKPTGEQILAPPSTRREISHCPKNNG